MLFDALILVVFCLIFDKGAFWNLLGSPWDHLGHAKFNVLRRLNLNAQKLQVLNAILGPFWTIWGHFGTFGVILGCLWGYLGHAKFDVLWRLNLNAQKL